MSLSFEWDPEKAEKNIRNHEITFDEACTSFRDPYSITIFDPLHSEEEDRFVLIGYSIFGKLLVVVHTERNDKIRIISVRSATKKENKYYEENAK